MNEPFPIEYAGQRYEALVPDTLDLTDRAALAINGIGAGNINQGLGDTGMPQADGGAGEQAEVAGVLDDNGGGRHGE